MGEEASVDLTAWSLQGGHRKDLRNALNKISKQGYVFKVNAPPQRPAFLQQLRAVSDEWLRGTERGELVFSQGRFDATELSGQTVLSVEAADGAVVAFINVIPSGVPGEGTFDLMRKVEGSPNGMMDFLFCRMFDYFREQGLTRCNLGMVPLSGITEPTDAKERAVKLAYERAGGMAHYRSLRQFKEKFDPQWQTTYLGYGEPLDLVQLAVALDRVVKEQ